MDIRYTSKDGKTELFVLRLKDETWGLAARVSPQGELKTLSSGFPGRPEAEKALVALGEKNRYVASSGFPRVKLINKSIWLQQEAEKFGALAVINTDLGQVLEMSLYQFDRIDVDLAEKDEFRFACYMGNNLTALFYIKPKDIVSTQEECIIHPMGCLQTLSIKKKPTRFI